LEHVALFVLGLALLAVGAALLVFGAARLDRRLGRSAFSVGAVAVAFGPCVAGLTLDLAIVLGPPPPRGVDPRVPAASVIGHVAGNIVAGVGLVLGAAALARPIAASARLFYTAIPLVLVAALMFWFVTVNAVVSRGAAGALLAASGVALAVLVFAAKRETEAVKAELSGWVPDRLAVWWAVLYVLAGLAATLCGAQLAAARLVYAGSVLRTSGPVLGETLVSFGTTVPTLVAAVAAARRGRSDLVLAVVVGFVLFNLLLVFGAVAMVQPLPRTTHAIKNEIPAVVLFAMLLVPVLLNGLKVPRWHGALLLVAYAAFVVWQVRRVEPVNP
jgi:cation:H+ antiporter